MRRIGRPSPALVVAMAALLVSLSGVAVALPGTNTVDSGDVVNDSLKSKDIKNGKVKSNDLKDNGVLADDLAGVEARPGNSVATTGEGGNGNNNLWARATSTATCEPGEQILSGYGEWLDESEFFDAVAIEDTSIDADANSITVTGINDSGTDRTFRATAICLS